MKCTVSRPWAMWSRDRKERAANVGCETFGRCANRSWIRSVLAATHVAWTAGSCVAELYANRTWSQLFSSWIRAMRAAYWGSKKGVVAGEVSVESLPAPMPRNSIGIRKSPKALAAKDALSQEVAQQLRGLDHD